MSNQQLVKLICNDEKLPTLFEEGGFVSFLYQIIKIVHKTFG